MDKKKTTIIILVIVIALLGWWVNSARRLPVGIMAESEDAVDDVLGSVPVVNVQDYGAIGDGVTDDATAIQAAIDAAADLRAQTGTSAGTVVYFPPGVYLCKSTLIFKPFLNYVGVRATTADTYDWTNFRDSHGSIIRAHTDIYDNDRNSYGVLVYIPTGDMTIENLTFAGTAAISGNPSVGLQFGSSPGSTRTHENDEQNASGINITGCTFYTFSRAWECYCLNDSRMYNPRFESNTLSILFSGQNRTRTAPTGPLSSPRTTNSVELFCPVIFASFIGIAFADNPNDAHEIRITGGSFHHIAPNTIHIEYGASKAPDIDFTAVGTFFRHDSSSGTYHIRMAGGYDNATQRWKFVGCRFYNGYCYFSRAYGTAASEGMEFHDCHFSSVDIKGNICYGCKINGGTMDDSVISATTCNYWQVQNVFFRNVVEPAIALSDKDCKDWVITGNYFDTDVATPISIATGSTGHIIKDNFGWDTENSGVAKIDSGYTSVRVAHGLVDTPSIINITFMNQTTNDYGRWWLSDIGNTYFTLNVAHDPGAGDLGFAWEAKVIRTETTTYTSINRASSSTTQSTTSSTTESTTEPAPLPLRRTRRR